MFRKNVAGQFIHLQGVDATTGGIKSGVTWTVRRCIDGTFAAGGGTVTEDGTTGWYKYAMSQADTNGNNIGFSFTGTGAVPQTVNIITDGSPPDVNTAKIGGQTVSASGTVTFPNATLASTTNITSASGVALAADQAVNATKIGGTTQTGRDIGASVLLSSGTGAGQLDFTSGVVKANLAQILGTALTETAGQIAAGVKKFFNVATPTGTVNSLPDAVAGAASGVAIVGSNMGTVSNVTGNVSGSVASVTADVGITQAGADKVWSTTARALTDKAGFALSTAGILAIWHQLTSAIVTAGTIGKLILDNLDAAITSRLASVSYTAPLDAAGVRSAVGLASANLDTQLSTIDDFLDTEIGAIKTKTDQLTFTVANQIDSNVIDWKGATAPAMTGDAFARLGAPVGASVSADIAATKSDTGAIKAKTDDLSFAPGIGVNANVTGVMGDSNPVAEIAQAVWEDDNSARTTVDSAGNKLRQALILYEGS